MLHLTIRQDNKELYGAGFSILSDSGELLGGIRFQGSMGSPEGSFQIAYAGHQLSMVHTGQRDAAKALGRGLFNMPKRCYYATIDNNACGWIGNVQVRLEHKTSGCQIFKLGNLEYGAYNVGYGERGTFYPCLLNDVPVGHVEKGCTAPLDLHNFSVMVYDEHDQANIFALLLLTCYRYVYTYYQAGQKLTKGFVRNVYTTTEKEVLEKFRYLNTYL